MRDQRNPSCNNPHTGYVVHDWKLARKLSGTLDRRQAIVIPVPSNYVGFALDTIVFIDLPPAWWQDDAELRAKYEAFCEGLKVILAPGGKIIYSFDAPPSLY